MADKSSSKPSSHSKSNGKVAGRENSRGNVVNLPNSRQGQSRNRVDDTLRPPPPREK